MGDVLEDSGDAAFHIVHGSAFWVVVARFRRFPYAVADVEISIPIYPSMVIQMYTVLVAVGRDVAAGWRGRRGYISIFGVLISADTATAGSRWAACLFLVRGFKGRFRWWWRREEGGYCGGASGGKGAGEGFGGWVRVCQHIRISQDMPCKGVFGGTKALPSPFRRPLRLPEASARSLSRAALRSRTSLFRWLRAAALQTFLCLSPFSASSSNSTCWRFFLLWETEDEEPDVVRWRLVSSWRLCMIRQ